MLIIKIIRVQKCQGIKYVRLVSAFAFFLKHFRFNFVDFGHSILMIFRILCGDTTDALHECWIAAGSSCVLLFYPTSLFGSFIVIFYSNYNIYLILI